VRLTCGTWQHRTERQLLAISRLMALLRHCHETATYRTLLAVLNKLVPILVHVYAGYRMYAGDAPLHGHKRGRYTHIENFRKSCIVEAVIYFTILAALVSIRHRMRRFLSAQMFGSAIERTMASILYSCCKCLFVGKHGLYDVRSCQVERLSPHNPCVLHVDIVNCHYQASHYFHMQKNTYN
jgi:hypothetical protein